MICGIDSSWGGLGWALATKSEVCDVGHVILGTKTWRWTALRDWLETEFAEIVVELLAQPAPPQPPRVVLEVPPAVYSGASRGTRGNQAATGHGLGTINGPILVESVRHRALAYPWEVTPDTWRAWWGVTGKGRLAKKRMAISIVRGLGHGRHLERFPETTEDLAPRADVAEAILIAMGAARNIAGAPKGPARGAAPPRELFPNATTRTP